jgi:hypothetical protein
METTKSFDEGRLINEHSSLPRALLLDRRRRKLENGIRKGENHIRAFEKVPRYVLQHLLPTSTKPPQWNLELCNSFDLERHAVQVIKNSNSSQGAFSRLLRRGFMASSLCIAIVGCSGGPARLDVPDYDPTGSASKAMELYDISGDGLLDDGELEKTPGLRASVESTDANKDGKLSEQEISDRIAGWLQSKVGLIQISCQVTLDGEAIDGATVTFTPDAIFKGAIEQAEDVTSIVGIAAPRIPVERLPAPNSPPGIQLGYYTVQISKKAGDRELIPAKYNVESILGQEVARDNPAISSNRMRFTLTSK